jgi:hypothetical protein
MDSRAEGRMLRFLSQPSGGLLGRSFGAPNFRACSRIIRSFLTGFTDD